MSALLLLAVSCKKEKEQGKGFNAIAEAHQDGSKTHLNGKAVNWDNNDQVLVFNKNYPAGYVFTASLVDSENPKKTLLLKYAEELGHKTIMFEASLFCVLEKYSI